MDGGGPKKASGRGKEAIPQRHPTLDSILRPMFRSKSAARRGHYRSSSFQASFLTGIHDLSHRQIRFDMGNSFVTMRRPVPNEERLARLLARYCPKNAYYSVGRWLEPHSVVPRSRATKASENLFLGCDIAFDIDFKPFSAKNIDLARKECRKLLGFIGSKGIKVRYIAFSGSKGFHVLCVDPNRYASPDPYERERQAKQYRIGLAKEVEALGIEIDSAITTDTRRVIRIPGTINQATGYVCRILSPDELSSPATEILKRTPRVTYSPLLTFWDDTILRIVCISPRGRAMKGKPGPEYFSTFASGAVLGAKDRTVPIFTYNGESAGNISRILQSVQHDYGLGDILLFQDGGEHSALSIDSIPLSRAIKVAKAGKSLGAAKLAMYKQGWLRIDARFAADGKTELSGKPRLVKILPATTRHPTSAGHALMLEREFGIKARVINPHGKEEYKLVHAIMRD